MSRPTFLTPDQLADRWGLAPKTIFKRIYEGSSLPRFVKLGDARNSPVRFRLSDVERYEDEHERGAA